MQLANKHDIKITVMHEMHCTIMSLKKLNITLKQLFGESLQHKLVFGLRGSVPNYYYYYYYVVGVFLVVFLCDRYFIKSRLEFHLTDSNPQLIGVTQSSILSVISV